MDFRAPRTRRMVSRRLGNIPPPALSFFVRTPAVKTAINVGLRAPIVGRQSPQITHVQQESRSSQSGRTMCLSNAHLATLKWATARECGECRLAEIPKKSRAQRWCALLMRRNRPSANKGIYLTLRGSENS